MVSGIEAGHESVVVGKRQRRKRRNELFRADAARRERSQIRRVGAVGVVPPPPIERDEDDDRIARLRAQTRERRDHGERSEQKRETSGDHFFAGASRSSSSVQLSTTFRAGAVEDLSFCGNLITRKRPSGATS